MLKQIEFRGVSLKVLYITHYTALYGANIALLNVIKQMRDEYGIEPVVLIKCKGLLSAALEKEGIEYIIHDFYGWMSDKGKKATWREYRSLFRNYCYAKEIAAQCNGLKIDLIHSNSSVVYIGAIIARLLKIPHIWQVGEFGEEDYGFNNMFPSCITRRFYYSAEAMINVSKAIYDKFQRNYPNIYKKVIYNGIPHSLEERECYNKQNDLEFCCTGLISPGKNQIEILHAVNLLVKEQITKFQVNFIGNSEGNYEKMLEKYVSDNGLEAYVKFWGYQSDVSQILTKMDVGIMSSQKEAFGLVTVEYMMASMPVIGTNAGGTREIIEAGITGDLYETGDVEALAGLMKKYIINREQLEDKGSKGYQRYKELYDISVQAGNVYSLYLQVMKGIK